MVNIVSSKSAEIFSKIKPKQTSKSKKTKALSSQGPMTQFQILALLTLWDMESFKATWACLT